MAGPDLITAWQIALTTLSDPINLLLLLLGTLLGVLMGMLPGLGGVVTLSLLIPLTFQLDPLVAFMLLVAANGGVSQGGSVTSILLNTPGMAPNAATILDGYPLARQGRGGEAIGAAAMASGAGAILGLVLLAVSIPVMLDIIILFGPPEIFWLALWGISVISIVVRGSIKSGLISGGIGMLFAMHGLSTVTGGTRWIYGYAELLDGVPLVPALLGVFAVAEMINLVSKGETIAADSEVEVGGGQWRGARAVFSHKWIFLRSALIGVIVGTIPGVGGTAANFIAYFQAVQTTENSDSYGSGDIRGVIASEASNDAKEGGAFIPTLGFGIPGSASMVVLFGAFLLHGILPGPLLMENHLDVVAIIIASALISNVASSAITMSLANKLVYVTKVDIRVVAPMVLGISAFAAFGLNYSFFNVAVTLLFGILGYMMIKVDMSRIPMILAMVLTPIVETNFFRSLQTSGGDYGIFVRGPIDIILILFILLSLFQPYVQAAIKQMRAKANV